MDYHDADALAAAALGLPEDAESDAVDVALYDRWGVDLDTFQAIAEALLPMATLGVSAITGVQYRGFAKDGAFVVKEPA